MLNLNHQLISLQKERERLLEAWRTAEIPSKIAILNRIEVIDEQIEKLRDKGNADVPRPKGLNRRFKRR